MPYAGKQILFLISFFFLSGISGTVFNMSLLTIHIKLSHKLMDPTGKELNIWPQGYYILVFRSAVVQLLDGQSLHVLASVPLLCLLIFCGSVSYL